MIVLVDTTIWSLALRRRPQALNEHERLLVEEWVRLVRLGQAVLIGPIRQEVLSGIRSPVAFTEIQLPEDTYDPRIRPWYIDALEKGPNKDNTIIVLWTDHGWSLGEKEHWRKFALWEEPTRTPYIWHVPGMTKAGTTSDRTVDLMSIYPTLCDLAGVEKPGHLEGHSIVPLLNDPAATWSHPAITTHGRGNHAVRTESHRYIRYANGDEELYDSVEDPYEYKNLASESGSAKIKKQLAAHLPKKEAPEKKK